MNDDLYLPRELWIYILEIKWWTARKNRLVKILRFPRKKHDYYICFHTGYHSWVIEDHRILYYLNHKLKSINILTI